MFSTYGHQRDSATMRISEWSAIRYDMSRTQDDRDKAGDQVGAWQKLQNDYASNQKLLWWPVEFTRRGKNSRLLRFFLGYALDGTHTENMNDYKECVKMNISKDDNIDLAIIQTKDKKIPADVENPISIDGASGDVKVGDDVFITWI